MFQVGNSVDDTYFYPLGFDWITHVCKFDVLGYYLLTFFMLGY